MIINLKKNRKYFVYKKGDENDKDTSTFKRKDEFLDEHNIKIRIRWKIKKNKI